MLFKSHFSIFFFFPLLFFSFPFLPFPFLLFSSHLLYSSFRHLHKTPTRYRAYMLWCPLELHRDLRKGKKNICNIIFSLSVLLLEYINTSLAYILLSFFLLLIAFLLLRLLSFSLSSFLPSLLLCSSSLKTDHLKPSTEFA